MAKTLYLVSVRARFAYNCAGCGALISAGSEYFRHEPNPYARVYRGEKRTKWCTKCLADAPNAKQDGFTKRWWVPLVSMPGKEPSLQGELDLVRPLQIRWLSLGQEFRNQLISDPALIYTLSPEQFEELICERLFAMGLEPKRIGNTNRKDGGIDIIFWPRDRGQFPFLGAAQVKHHRSRKIKEKSATVRDFVGTLAQQPFNAGLIVTNTSFSADAKWYAEKHTNLVRLRDMSDIQRWLYNNFSDAAEWREIPKSITLCPGVTVTIG